MYSKGLQILLMLVAGLLLSTIVRADLTVGMTELDVKNVYGEPKFIENNSQDDVIWYYSKDTDNGRFVRFLHGKAYCWGGVGSYEKNTAGKPAIIERTPTESPRAESSSSGWFGAFLGAAVNAYVASKTTQSTPGNLHAPTQAPREIPSKSYAVPDGQCVTWSKTNDGITYCAKYNN